MQQVIVQTRYPNEAAANELFSLPTVSWQRWLAVSSAETYRNGALGYLGPRYEICNNRFDFFFQSAQTEI